MRPARRKRAHIRAISLSGVQPIEAVAPVRVASVEGMPQVGAVYYVEYPFVLRDAWAVDAPMAWSPGRDEVNDGTYRCSGWGKQVLTVVGVMQIPGFQARIFYTRSWIDPDGKAFASHSRRLFAKTLTQFRWTCAAYHGTVTLYPSTDTAAAPQPPWEDAVVYGDGT